MNFYDEAPTYERLRRQIDKLNSTYTDLNVFSIGKSLCNRELYALLIGNAQKVTLFAATFHAQEWINTLLVMRFAQELLENIDNNAYIKNAYVRLEQRGIAIVPMINPDGVEIALNGYKTAGRYSNLVKAILKNAKRSYQANARGVDINHNFDAGFLKLKSLERDAGITSPCERQYGGERPHSEPESKALVDFLESRVVESVYAFHSQGEEIFYGYGGYEPPQGRIMAEILSERSGYALTQNDGLYSYGGFKDYFIEKYRRPGFTFETGKGENPLPIGDFTDIYEKVLPALKIAAVL